MVNTIQLERHELLTSVRTAERQWSSCLGIIAQMNLGGCSGMCCVLRDVSAVTGIGRSETRLWWHDA